MIGGNTMLNRKLTVDDFNMDPEILEQFKTFSTDVGKKQIPNTDVYYTEKNPLTDIKKIGTVVSMSVKQIYEDLIGAERVVPIKIFLESKEDTYDVVSCKKMIDKLSQDDIYIVIIMIIISNKDGKFIDEIFDMYNDICYLYEQFFEYKLLLKQIQKNKDKIDKMKHSYESGQEFIEPTDKHYQKVIEFIEKYKKIYFKIFGKYNMSGGNPTSVVAPIVIPPTVPKIISGQQVNFNIFGCEQLQYPSYHPYMGVLPYISNIPNIPNIPNFYGTKSKKLNLGDKSNDEIVKKLLGEYKYDKYNRTYGSSLFENINLEKIPVDIIEEAYECVNILLNVLEYYDIYKECFMHYDYGHINIYDEFFQEHSIENILDLNKTAVANKISKSFSITLLVVSICYNNEDLANKSNHANIVFCSDGVSVRIEPHRKADYYCRNSLRNEIRKYLPTEFLYIDNLLLTEYSGLQSNEKTRDEYMRLKTDIIEIDDQILNNTGGYCVSWCLMSFIIILMNMKHGLLNISKYLTTFGLPFKYIKDDMPKLLSTIRYIPDEYNSSKYLTKIAQNLYMIETDFFDNDYYNVVKKSLLYDTMLVVISKLRDLSKHDSNFKHKFSAFKNINDYATNMMNDIRILQEDEAIYLKKYKEIKKVIHDDLVVYGRFRNKINEQTQFIDVHEQIDREYTEEMCAVDFYKTNPTIMSVKQEYLNDIFDNNIKQYIKAMYSKYIADSAKKEKFIKKE